MGGSPVHTRYCGQKRSLVLGGLFATMLLLLFGWGLSPLQAQTQLPPQPPFSEGDYRERELEIKRQELELKRESLYLEREKVWFSLAGTVVPILAGVLAVLGVIISANKSASAALTASTRTTEASLITKLTELSLQGEGPNEVVNRAKLLVQMYASRLPEDFVGNVKKIDDRDIGRIATEAPWTTEFAKELVEMCAKYPDQRQKILSDYKAIFDYPFIDVLINNSGVPQPFKPPPHGGS